MTLNNRTLLLGLASIFLLPGCGPEDLNPGSPNPITENPPPLEEICTAANCAGCCDPATNKCVQVRTDDACGVTGTTCVKCAPGTMCHPAQQQCYTPTIRTKIQPLRATIAPHDPADDSDWDVDGSPPDAVVELFCPNAQPAASRSEEIESFTPNWTQGFCDVLSTDLLSMPIQFNVLDVDAIFDDKVASAQYQVTQGDIERGVLQFTGSSGLTSISFQLTTYYAQ
ncbi:hypothetical protein ACQKGO_29790 [Corallococcus interemptor]|uniref:hypothetical protein n=1 Tax=Corallococcus interemptor TaxID=2316720 RepID=UPI003D041B13